MQMLVPNALPGCRLCTEATANGRDQSQTGESPAAQFPARRCLCLYFTRHLAAPGARLEVEMVRYSFLVGLIHPDCTPALIPTIARLYSRAQARFTVHDA